MSDGGERVEEILLRLEKQLMDPDFRKDREKVAALLAEGFREFGSSGRIFGRAEILELLAEEVGWTAPVVADFGVRMIAAGTALVTYRAIRAESVTLRSSVWVARERGWRMLFHQGTRVPN